MSIALSEGAPACLPKRPRGYVNTPAATGAAVRTLLRRFGIEPVMDLFGLGRMAIYALAAEQTVQAQTLAAASDGLSRVYELEAVTVDAR